MIVRPDFYVYGGSADETDLELIALALIGTSRQAASKLRAAS